MILALGARGRGFDSHKTPIFLFLLNSIFVAKNMVTNISATKNNFMVFFLSLTVITLLDTIG